jgi:hypothetical protein
VTKYAQKVAVVNSSGDHVRFVPGGVAHALVEGGSANTPGVSGTVRSISLLRTAANSAQRIGEPATKCNGVRFYRVVSVEVSATRIYEHHPRCLW